MWTWRWAYVVTMLSTGNLTIYLSIKLFSYSGYRVIDYHLGNRFVFVLCVTTHWQLRSFRANQLQVMGTQLCQPPYVCNIYTCTCICICWVKYVCIYLLVIAWDWCLLHSATSLKCHATGTQNDTPSRHIILITGKPVTVHPMSGKELQVPMLKVCTGLGREPITFLT